MTFPVMIGVAAWRIHPHLLFEVLGYATGGWLFLRARHSRGDLLSVHDRWAIVAAAILGGAIGSRLLFWLERPELIATHWLTPLAWPVGKTIVGGLIGGLVAVELTKRRRGVRTATGDLLAVPLAAGIAVGRIGCFLTGLDDHTFGNATPLWTGVDFGDGVRRHPTALYEAVFLAGLTVVLIAVRARHPRPGTEFRLFMVSYLGFRLLIDFIKPEPVLAAGLSAIQWACAITIAWYFFSQWRRHGHAVA